MKKIIGILIALMALAHAQQVSILSLDLGRQANIGQSGTARIMNAGSNAMQVLLSIEVRNQRGAIIIQNTSKPQTLQAGLNVFDLSDIAQSLRERALTGVEGPQAAEVCLEVLDLTKDILASQFKSLPPVVSLPPFLVYPFEGEVLESSVVMFTWTPPMPLPSNEITSYTLTIVELGQTGFSKSPELAIQQQQPFFQQSKIPGNTLSYPASAPRLEGGKTYAWQVSAETYNRVLGITQVWTFSVDEQKRLVPEEKSAPFVDLKRRDDASIYPAREVVRFKFPNPYSEAQFSLHIIDGKGKVMPFEQEWLSDLGNGLYELKLPLAAGFKAGAFYELEIRDRKSGYYTLKMRYIMRDRIEE
jgi:hypothetical protein